MKAQHEKLILIQKIMKNSTKDSGLGGMMMIK
jgi:hypothetical protein